MKMLIVAAVAWACGVLLGCWLARHALRRMRKRLRALMDKKKPGKMGTMDKILILEAVVLVAYTVADLVVFWHTGSEPGTLTACVFGVCGLENGVMGWIKTNKDKANAPSGSGQDGGEPAASRTEPPDVGV